MWCGAADMAPEASAQRLLAVTGDVWPHAPAESVLSRARPVLNATRLQKVYSWRVVLRDVTLTLRRGERVGLVGTNGSGKSTLAYLLMRFIQPTSGRITIDGKDISQYSLESIRHAVGLVAQHTLLLNGSVAENIAYGRYKASKEDIERAARASGAHEFNTQMPDGYDTTIGDQGIRLSGGQRQRLSLARTLLTDPPILILDEATSALDTENEARIRTAIENLHGDLTVVIIGHRLPTL